MGKDYLVQAMLDDDIVREKTDTASESALSDLLCEHIDPWPLKDVLSKLVEAANILLKDHDYDGHGWEQIQSARDRAISIIEST